MDTSEAKRIVRENIHRLRDQLGLGDWHITTTYNRLGDDVAGRCTVHSEYKRAHIEIDNDKCDDEAEVLRILRHELVHIFCWPMHTYGVHVYEMTDGRSNDHMWTFTLERLVRSVEELLEAHDVPLLPESEPDPGLTD